MTHDEMIEVIQAHKEGKPLQYAALGCKYVDFSDEDDLYDVLKKLSAAFHVRVKPEPRAFVICRGKVCDGEGCNRMYNCKNAIHAIEDMETNKS